MTAASVPFLSIVTRASQRPEALLRCVESVMQQSCNDFEQVFLVDHDHRGLRYANQLFHEHRDVPSGRYVWALDDDNIMANNHFVRVIKKTAKRTDADVILVKMVHQHTGKVHPNPELWGLDWKRGERPEEWAGGGSCVVVKRDVWAAHTDSYYDGQGIAWATGGDWHFITSLIEDESLTFAQCDVISATQPARGYGKETEDCGPRWFDRVARKLDLAQYSNEVFVYDYRINPSTWVDSDKLGFSKPIKVLQCATWDWAGCGCFLSQAINTRSIHTSRAIRWKEDHRFRFPTDIVSPSPEEFKRHWEWADVIHIHDDAPIPRGWKPKPTVITMHGSKYRKSPDKYLRLIEQRGWFLTVATPDLTKIHNAPWMPDTRILPRPSGPPIEGFVVLHCPSIRANKGTKHVIAAAKTVSNIDFRLVEDLTWDETIRLKSRIERGVLVDQFEWGYGCNAIEAWAYGLPVISHVVGDSRKAFKRLFGYFPFLDTSPGNVAQAIRQMRKAQTYERIKAIGRGHYERYHAPAATAGIALEYYKRVLDQGVVRQIEETEPGKTGSRGLVLLRYCGHNAGKMTFRGPRTKEPYRFSALDRYKYVDRRDVPGLLGIKRHTRRLFEIAEE